MYLADAAATDALGVRLARALRQWSRGLVVALDGELGAGKTALTRATLVELGHTGRVVSPSYTLVEPYTVAGRGFHHLDLYRLGDPEELEFLGVRDIDSANDWLFIEWSCRGTGFLPGIDMRIALAYERTGRRARISATTDRGRAFMGVVEDIT